MIRKLINMVLEFKINLIIRRKRKTILNNIETKTISEKSKKEFINKWSKFDKSTDDSYLKIFASINGMESKNYVPENIYYNRIEPVLNDKTFALAYSDKNFYNNYLPEYTDVFPRVLLRGINGKIYNNSYVLLLNPKKLADLFAGDINYFILKPAVETSGGSSVKILNYCDDFFWIDDIKFSLEEFYNYLLEVYSGNFIIQERIDQLDWFKEFNETSLNTIRVFTYRSIKTNEVNVLQSVLRFGKPGSIVDNQAAGGYTCGISESHKLNHYAVDKSGRVYTDNTTVKKLSGSDVPGLNNMYEIAKQIASEYYYHHLLGFDFCVDSSGKVRLLEINCKNIETNFLQMNNGPLFRDYTDEIIDYCLNHPKSIVLDFKLQA